MADETAQCEKVLATKACRSKFDPLYPHEGEENQLHKAVLRPLNTPCGTYTNNSKYLNRKEGHLLLFFQTTLVQLPAPTW